MNPATLIQAGIFAEIQNRFNSDSLTSRNDNPINRPQSPHHLLTSKKRKIIVEYSPGPNGSPVIDRDESPFQTPQEQKTKPKNVSKANKDSRSVPKQRPLRRESLLSSISPGKSHKGKCFIKEIDLDELAKSDSKKDKEQQFSPLPKTWTYIHASQNKLVISTKEKKIRASTTRNMKKSEIPEKSP